MRIQKILNLSAKCFLVAVCGSSVAEAREPVGQLQIEALSLRPTFSASEDGGTNFELSESFLSLQWQKDQKISAYAAIGSEKLINLPVYYADTHEDKIAFTQAFAQYNGIYGRLRFGLVPLLFGYDGGLRNDEHIFDRSLVYELRLIGLSDRGASFYTEHNNFYTQITAHNGEVDTTSDGRMWVSGNWGYYNQRNLRVQLSLQAGHVKGDVSDGASMNEEFGIRDGEGAKWRNGLLFLNWQPRDWNVMLQVGGGEYEQKGRSGSYKTLTGEALRTFDKNNQVGLRYDALDPNNDVADDSATNMSLAYVIKSTDGASRFILLGTKSFEDGTQLNDDKIQLTWLLTPLTH